MKKIYKSHLKTASLITNDVDRVMYLTSVLRSLLQTTVITSIEVINALTPNDEIDLYSFLNRFNKPSDGLPIEILHTVVPYLRTYIDKQFMWGWYEEINPNLKSLKIELSEWLEYRNSRSGHGVIDLPLAKEWADRSTNIIELCLQVFKLVIPSLDDEGLKLGPDINNLKISTPLCRDKNATVITKVLAKKGTWKIKGQVLSRDNSNEFLTNLSENNIFSNQGDKPNDLYHAIEITPNDKSHPIFHNLPIRQTDTFEGRKKELNTLKDWIEDEDSRYCLVFGDGGYGKTTLVLEFLNMFVDDEFELDQPLPSIISYHTAKMTKWTEDGIVHFKEVSGAMAENIRELMRLFYPILGKEWFGISDRQLVDKAATVLADNNITRDEVLIVFDNTETLATSTEEVEELGAFFKKVGKKIGRLIITSRRREFIEATPILIKGLTEKESINLINRIAKEHDANSILQAGEARLRKVSKQLANKPLLIDALVKHISHSGLGIDAALNNIFKKSNEELLEFLYEDAWVRMNEAQKQVFLVLVHLTSPIDQYSISQSCLEIGIQHTEFQLALDETYFASVTDYGNTYSIEIVDLAKRFFQQQFKKLRDDEQKEVIHCAENADKNVRLKEKIEKEYNADRVAEAFRSEFAKAAKILVDKNHIDEAIEMYEFAIEDDPLNSALFDRFAWLLFNRVQNYEYAKVIAEKAVDLNAKNGDALVNLALIHYRLGNMEKGDEFIDKASQNGRTISFCHLRKAIARYHEVKNISSIPISFNRLDESIELLESANRFNKREDRYFHKNKQSIDKYLALTKRELTILKARNTKSKS